jgi:hypothetical protein
MSSASAARITDAEIPTMAVPPSSHPSEPTLQGYSLGQLDDIPTEAVHKHLEDCPDCRALAADMSSDSFLERLRAAPAGPAFSEATGSDAGPPRAGRTSTGPGAVSAATLPPGLADHADYEILRELGRGGMGVVYLAHNRLLGRDEVLKVVGKHLVERAGVLDRFLREICAVGRLRHPNIVSAIFGLPARREHRVLDGVRRGPRPVPDGQGPGPLAGGACLFLHLPRRAGTPARARTGIGAP